MMREHLQNKQKQKIAHAAVSGTLTTQSMNRNPQIRQTRKLEKQWVTLHWTSKARAHGTYEPYAIYIDRHKLTVQSTPLKTSFLK